MYTTHGYHISGTTQSYPKPVMIVRCRGFIACEKCIEEARIALLELDNTNRKKK